MNHTYRVVWQESTRTWVAAAETVRGRRKGTRALAAVLLLVAGSAFGGIDPNTLPTGYQLKAGAADAPKTVGNEMVIDQKSLRAVYGWDSFNVGSNASVYFKQTGANAVAMNLIGGNEASQIYGKLRADGQVFLMNPNGVVFAPGARIDVGGLLATTMNMNADDFMNGDYRLSGAGSGTIRNEGLIKAAGSIVLVGNTVENAGTITAASVTLVAGSKVAIDLTGDGLIRARVENPALRARITNEAGGNITATLSVAMTAGDAKNALDSIVNNTGTIRAVGLVERGGEILLEGTKVANNGMLDVSSTTGTGGRIDLAAVDIDLGTKSVIDATGTSGGRIIVMGDLKKGHASIDGLIKAVATGNRTTDDGGFIETSAAEVRIADSFRVNALSAYGRAGKWLIDPIDFYITAGSGSQTSSGIGATTLSTALGGADVTIQTENGGIQDEQGDIYVNSAVSWTANTILTLRARRHIQVNANIKATGNTAGLRLFYGSTDGTVAPENGAKYSLNNGASITLSGTNPLLWIGNKQYTVINSLAALQAMNGNLSGDYALGSDLDASATSGWNSGAGFAPIGNDSTAFAGAFDGLGHTIRNLAINRSASDYVGLFGHNAGSIMNIALAGGSVTGHYYVGALAGWNEGYIGNTSSGAAVLADKYLGGLVGSNVGGTIGSAVITKSFATGSVTSSSTGSGGSMGGLVGENGGWYAPAYGSISESYATGNVKYSGGGNSWSVGGLLGTNYGTIVDSYATGAVTSYSVSGLGLGGFVGYNAPNDAGFGGTISGSWSSGGVANGGMSFGTNIGPFVGRNEGSITNSYWDKTLNCCGVNGYGTNTGTVTNLVGLTTSEFLNPANLANLGFSGGLNNSAKWWMVSGYTRPFLRSEWAAYISNAHQLQLMGMNATASYTLNADIDLASVLKPANQLVPSGGGNYVEAASMWGGWSGWDVGTVTSASFAPIATLTGSFDGQGHTISNLFISRGATDYVGLFAKNYGQISNVILSNANVTGKDYVGLLAGANYGAIVDGHVTGQVNGHFATGGLVGYNDATGSIDDSYSQGSAAGTANATGGLVGSNFGEVEDSYSTATVQGNSKVGGLVGENVGGTISNSIAWGNVTASAEAVGGLVGWSTGSITTSHAFGNVAGSYNVGGLVGENYAAISNSYFATGNIQATHHAGGLVGYNQGEITDSYAEGALLDTGAHTVGGLVGENAAFGGIRRSYASWTTVKGSNYVGGLVGKNVDYAEISNSYATGQVIGTGSDIGGLVGENSASIDKSYATTAATGAANVGGLVGNNSGSVSNSIWNADANADGFGSDTGTQSGVSGLALDDMRNLATYTALGWNIDDTGGTGKVWRIYDGHTTPLLRAFLTPLTVIADNVSKTYDGDTYPGGLENVVYSIGSAEDSSALFNKNTPYEGVTVGEHLPKLYSKQKGYDISYVNARLTITGIVVPPDPVPTPDSDPTATPDSTPATDPTPVPEAQTTAAATVKSVTDDNSDAGSGAGLVYTPPVTTSAPPEKPADEGPVPARSKGRMLVCRGK